MIIRKSKSRESKWGYFVRPWLMVFCVEDQNLIQGNALLGLCAFYCIIPTGAYPGGSGPPLKKFEPQREHGSKFLGGGQDPPGYTHEYQWHNKEGAV